MSTRKTLVMLLVGVVGCAQGERSRTADPLAGEVVPAAAPPAVAAGAIAARYWVEIDPRRGTMELYPLHFGNVIYRAERLLSGVNYDYEGSADEASDCTPGTNCPDGTVHLYTDPELVTWVEATPGVGGPELDCYSNGLTFVDDPSCGGRLAEGNPCRDASVFCGPIQMTSSYDHPLADPILDIANSTLGFEDPPVLGCLTDASNSMGLCTQSSGAKVDPLTSSYQPSILGDGETTLACGYCYGNMSTASNAGRPGLADTLLPGVDATLQGIYTDHLALKLADGAGLTITLSVIHAMPSFDQPGTQIQLVDDVGAYRVDCIDPQAPTVVTVSGGAFGPPADCLIGGLPAECDDTELPATGCCASGPSSTGHGLSLVGPAGQQATQEWSDTYVATTPVTGGVYGCGVTITTPSGSILTHDEITVCGDSWRAYAAPGLTGKVHAAGGVLGNSTIVIAGGRSASMPTSGTSSVQALALPSCADPSPSTPTELADLPAPRWGAASAVVGDALYVIGGAEDGDGCASTVYRLGAGDTTWTTKSPLPQVLCQATAVTLIDRVDGLEYIVVAGGIDRPNPRTTLSPAPSLNANTYVYDPRLNTWTTYSGAGEVLSTPRYNAGGALFDGSGFFSDGPVGLIVGGAVVATGAAPAVDNVDEVTMENGVPAFAARTPLPTAASLPGVASVGGVFYVVGGAPNAGTTTPGTTQQYALDQADLSGAWTALEAAPHARQGGVLVVSQFDEENTGSGYSNLTRLLHLVGASDDPSTDVNEYQP